MTSTPDIEAAVRALRAGQLIGLPTETVYGLGADALNPDAVRLIFSAKGRPSTHPVIVHLDDTATLAHWAADVPDAAQALARRFWPGPLTLVLPRGPLVPLEVTGGQDTVALRVPAHPVALDLLRAFGGGVAAPSANRYGHISPTTADAVREELGSAVAVVLDGGPCAVGIESTIVACLEGKVTVLRPGHITHEDVRRVVGRLDEPNPDQPRVPGSTRSHYAPATDVELVDGRELEARVVQHREAGLRVAVLALHPSLTTSDGSWVEASSTAAQYGHDLYAHLRALDRLGADRLLVERPPTGDAWTAIHDRLERAAAGRTDDVADRFPESTAP